MINLTDLIAKLQAAKEGSRELDAEIAVALGWNHALRPRGWEWNSPSGDYAILPEFTTDTEGLGLAVEHTQSKLPEWSLSFRPEGVVMHRREGPLVISDHKSIKNAAWIAIFTAMQQGE